MRRDVFPCTLSVENPKGRVMLSKVVAKGVPIRTILAATKKYNVLSTAKAVFRRLKTLD
jgi:hypothetical protein